MLTVSRHTDRQPAGHGAFQLQLVRPGFRLGNPADAGLGPLGRVDHAVVQPGLVVPMHEHRNDEILSYVRRGRVTHDDSTGVQQTLSPTRFMLMSAGRGFSHEEAVLDGPGPLEMLQIFIRPAAPDLSPLVAFHEFDAADSLNAWRLVAGPENTGAPLSIRSQAWVYDAHLTHRTLDLPALAGRAAFLYVFGGAVELPGKNLGLQAGDSVVIRDEAVRLTAPAAADVVLFLLDQEAPFSRAGSMSG